MKREGVLFYAIAFSAGTVGTLIGTLLDWGETGVFVAGMGPVAVVILIFMLRERRDESPGGHVKPPAGHVP